MIKLIAIVDSDFGVSKNGKIPWSFSDDLRFFREKTEGGVVVMGKKTYFSIPEPPLKNRINCVLSRSASSIDGAEIFSDIDSVVAKYPDMWVIGGADIYNQFLEKDLIQYAVIIKVHKSFDADKFINKNLLANFEMKTLFASEAYSICEGPFNRPLKNETQLDYNS